MRTSTAILGMLLLALIAGLIFVLLNIDSPPSAPIDETARPPSPESSGSGTGESAPEAAPIPDNEARPPTAAAKKTADVAKPATDRETESGTVTGTVHTQTGTPVADARVRALTRRSPFHRGLEPLDLVTHSDEHGHFSFTGIDPGYRRVIVEVEARGFCRDAASVQLGKSIAFVLGPPGVLRGRVSFVGEGAPCEGAIVSLHAIEIGIVASMKATTDADGRYRIENVKPGTFRVNVGANDLPFSPLSTSVVIQPGRDTIGDFEVERGITLRGRVVDAATRVPIRSAEVSRFGMQQPKTVTDGDGRFTLGPLSKRTPLVIKADGYLPLTTRLDPVPNNGDRTELVREFGLARAASVKGRVLDPDGQPVAGAKVRAAGTRPGTSDRTESLEDGTFCLKSVPEGAEVRLIAEKAGLARAILGPFAFWAAEPRAEIVLRLGNGGVVSGRLTDTTGAPITKGRVHLNPQLRMYGGQHSATPDKDGNYRIETVPAGRYSLEVWVQDYVGRKRPDFVVEEGGEYDGIDFVLERGLTITGVVVDQAGNPVEDASIHTTPISPGKDDIPGVRTARTDAEGRFTLTALTSGSHGITIMRQGYAQKNPRAQVRAGEQNVVLEMIKLHEGIVGQVLQQETGTPLTRFFVRWHRGVSAFTRDFTDEEGRFQIKNLIPGVYYLEAGTKEGLVSPQPVRVELIDGTVSVPIQLHVGPGEVITARVLSADGTALAQAQIEIVRAVGEPTGVMGRGITDQAGGCRITSIAPGDYVARASHGDWIEVERAFTVRRGRENHVELKLEAKGGTFEVSVKDPRGRPVEGATLRVMRPNGAVMYPDNLKYGRLYQELKKTSPDLDGQVFRARRYRTSADGMVERRFLPAGRLIIEVNKAGYRPGRQEAESLSGVTTRVAITLEPTT